MWSFLKSKITWHFPLYTSVLLSWRLTKLSLFHLGVCSCVWFFFLSMCVCLCLFDFLLHIRLQKKRTTAWHGRHGCPYPTHQPVCKLVQQLAEQQALAETRCSPYTLTAIEHTGVIVLAHIQILASMFGRSQDCSNRVKKMGNQSHGKFMNKWLSVIHLL